MTNVAVGDRVVIDPTILVNSLRSLFFFDLILRDTCMYNPLAFNTQCENNPYHPSQECGHCFFCVRGNQIMCLNFDGLGITLPGGFAEYVVSSVFFFSYHQQHKNIDVSLSLSLSALWGFCIVVLAKSSNFTI